ncbi:hypothetical protein NKR23_g6789 [Pleurostoma richardsiae]|uniref:Heterokaryon incompatibility protein n=1 Tax=Pleurostoma richardsiae TaxID=41990 RepID=A0AA38VNI0_9PEZI|nr:hypothetical protein NKR23_g6789 [Pleurostoma richardsiae]
MHEIYSGAVLNLSAVSARDGSGGMIFDRDTLPLTPIVLEFETSPPAGKTGKLTLFKDDWTARVERGPVNQRGWVFQERMLAPRVLYFAKDQVYWECNSLAASETHPAADDGTLALGFTQPKKRVMCNISTSDIYLTWAGFVQAYTAGKLTYQSDRLVAISAIARTMCEAAGLHSDDYICGHWTTHLPRSLLWIMERPGRRPAEYIAPTWSWASVEGIVLRQPNDEVDADLITLVDISTTLKSGDPFGEVLNGYARLRGSMRRTRIRQIKAPENLDTEYLLVQLNGQAVEQFPSGFYPSLVVDWDTEEDVLRTGIDVELHYLPFYLEGTEMDLGCHEHDATCSPFCYTSGLILRRTGSQGQYRRVAFVHQFGGVDTQESLEQRSWGLLECTTSPLGEGEYLDVDNNGKCLIEIV